MMPDYEERGKNYDFATPQAVLKALSQKETIVLDVRSEDEIAESGSLASESAVKAQWKQTACTATECPILESDPSKFVGDKNATVVIYCRSGRRVVKAREILKNYGCKTILNAGGYDDVMKMLKKE